MSTETKYLDAKDSDCRGRLVFQSSRTARMSALLMMRPKDDPESYAPVDYSKCRFLILAGLPLKGFGPNWSATENGVCVAYGEST